MLIIGAAVAAFVLFKKTLEYFHSKTPEGQLEKLQEKTDACAKAAKDAANAYDELASAIDSLRSQEDALDGLTKGTAEYSAAVAKLNQDLIDLLVKYDLLGDSKFQLTTSSEHPGLYEIAGGNEKLYEYILAEQSKVLNAATAQSVISETKTALQKQRVNN